MNKVFLIYLGIAATIIAVILAIFFKTAILTSPPITSAATGCYVLVQSGTAQEKINLLFYGNEDEALTMYNKLFSIEPYKSEQTSFNAYYIPKEIHDPACTYYEGIAVYCYSRELIKQSGICPHDYIIVGKDEAPRIRSAAFSNVVSINLNNKDNVLAHEFAHVLANLADEYVPAKMPKKAKNCPKTCEEFQGQEEGCYSGCSETTRYRSINNGLMKTLSSKDFGTYNDNLLQEAITSILEKKSVSIPITGKAIGDLETTCQNQYYLFLEGTYNQGVFTWLEPHIYEGCSGGTGIGDYSYELIMQDDTTYTQGSFNPALVFAEAGGEGDIEGTIYEYTGPIYLEAPLIPEAKTLTIRDNEGTLVSSINLALDSIITLLQEVNDAQFCTN